MIETERKLQNHYDLVTSATMSNVTDNVFKFNRVKRIDRRNTRSLCVKPAK